MLGDLYIFKRLEVLRVKRITLETFLEESTLVMQLSGPCELVVVIINGCKCLEDRNSHLESAMADSKWEDARSNCLCSAEATGSSWA